MFLLILLKNLVQEKKTTNYERALNTQRNKLLIIILKKSENIFFDSESVPQPLPPTTCVETNLKDFFFTLLESGEIYKRGANLGQKIVHPDFVKTDFAHSCRFEEESLLDHWKKKSVNRTANQMSKIEKAKRYIKENFDQNISLETICRISCLSKFHFCRVFKSAVGLSFSKYLNKIRLGESLNLIFESNNISITDVCFLVGYNDLTYFERVFKRRLGFTPTEVKKLVTYKSNIVQVFFEYR